MRHTGLAQAQKSALTEHKSEMIHNIDFVNTTILDKASG
jgi:hypothetical protein